MDIIWEGFKLLSILLLEILEFWIIYFESFNLLHDEFLYDEILNSYHSQIHMFARLQKPPLIFQPISIEDS